MQRNVIPFPFTPKPIHTRVSNAYVTAQQIGRRNPHMLEML